MLSYLARPRSALALIAPKKHIFLVSHMRAYSSLFGHIMGNNPEICGYYEMHIGYHSWKSLVRQKLLFFEREDAKPGFTYMFDKVLHDDHLLSIDLLNSPSIKAIFCLRSPEDTIPSILKLYDEVDPTHDFNSATFATRYYIQRLKTMENMAIALDSPFFFLDAEAITGDTDNCLGSLSEWLQLSEPLSSNYAMQRETSRKKFGDTSDRLKAGKIVTSTSSYGDVHINNELKESARSAYAHARDILIAKSSAQCLRATTPDGAF